MQVADFDNSLGTRKLLEILERNTGKKVTVSRARPRRSPRIHTVRTRPAPRVQRNYLVRANLRDSVHAMYQGIMDSGAIISPRNDIKLGNRTEIKLTPNGIEKFVRSDEGYNSTLLFTFISALMKKASVLYFGEPGTGKTTAPEIVINRVRGTSFEHIQEATIYGNPELTASDMIATLDIAQLMRGREVVIPREFMRSEVKIIDETNRLPPAKLSVLYQLVDRGFAVFKNRKIQVPFGPLYATANYKDSGNYDIPKPFLDRFDVALKTQYINPNYACFFTDTRDLESIAGEPLNPAEINQIRAEISAVKFQQDALSRFVYFISELTYCALAGRETEEKIKSNAESKKPGELCAQGCHYSNDVNICNQTVNGLSTRSYPRIFSYLKAIAWWRGKSQVDREEFEVVLPYALAHKLTPTNQAFENDLVYHNDKYALVKDLFAKANRSYDLVGAKTQVVRDAPCIVSNVYALGKKNGLTAKQIDQMIKKEIPKVDSCSKFALTIALNDCYERLK